MARPVLKIDKTYVSASQTQQYVAFLDDFQSAVKTLSQFV